MLNDKKSPRPSTPQSCFLSIVLFCLLSFFLLQISNNINIPDGAANDFTKTLTPQNPLSPFPILSHTPFFSHFFNHRGGGGGCFDGNCQNPQCENFNAIHIGEILGFGFPARIFALDRGATTVEDLLRETMDGGVDRTASRRPSLKERLGLKGLGCCGATWGLGPGPTTISVMDDEEEMGHGSGPISPEIGPAHNPTETGSTPPCVVQSPGMNLAAALAAERQLRAAVDSDSGGGDRRPDGGEGRSPGTPSRVSLMRLLEETDGYDAEMRKEEYGGGCDPLCCVCMGRKKGAAFIPCGHTFCRVCSREVWLNRGSCPLCNRSILEILDIY